MARDLDVGFTVFANTQPAVQPMVKLNRVIGKTDKEMERFGKNLKRRAVQQQRQFAAAVRASSFALAALGVGLLKTAKVAGDYDRQIRLAALLTNNTGEAFTEFDAGVKSVASDLAQLPGEVAKAAQAIGRLGFRGSEAMVLLRNSVSLATASAGELTSPQAAAAVSTALRAFGKGAEDAAATTDSLTNAVVSTALNFKKLPLALGTSAGFASAFGASLNELLGILGAVNDVIPRTERAATGVRNIFRDLSQSTTKAKLASAGLNLQITDSAGNFRNILPILTELFQQTDKMTEAQRLQAFQTGFSIEAATTLAALQGRLAAGVEGVNGEVVTGIAGLSLLVKKMGDAGTTGSIVEEVLKGAAGAMQFFKSETALAAIEIGTAINEFLAPALNFVTGLIKGLREAIANASPTTKAIIGIFGAGAIILGIVATALIAASFAMGGWALITTTATAANVAFVASLVPIAVAIAGIVALVIIFRDVIKKAFAVALRFRLAIGFGAPGDRERIRVLEGGRPLIAKEGSGGGGEGAPTGADAISAARSAALDIQNTGTSEEKRRVVAAFRSDDSDEERAKSILAIRGGEGSGGDGGSETRVILEMDSKKVGEAIIERRQRENRRTFRPLNA